LEGTLNLEKSGIDFDEWLHKTCRQFREFIEKRKQLLFSKLKKLLA